MDRLDSIVLMSGYEGHTGQFAMSELEEMETEAISLSCTSESTSRSHSYSVPEEVQSGQYSVPSESEKVCPLLAGQTFQCTPELCGPDAACLDFPTIPDIEDGISLPCITQKLSSSSEPAKTSQLAFVPVADTIRLRSSTSQSRRPTRNSRQRPQSTNPDSSDAKSVAKKAHSLVERRYRENLNGTIAQLHLALLKTKRVTSIAPQDQGSDLEEQMQAFSKVRKSEVMLEAVEYIHQTEVELRHMADEIVLLTKRVRQLEKLVKCEDCLLVKQLVNFGL